MIWDFVHLLAICFLKLTFLFTGKVCFLMIIIVCFRLRSIAHSQTLDSYRTNVDILKSSVYWKDAPQLKKWFEGKWLSNSKVYVQYFFYWIWCKWIFRKERETVRGRDRYCNSQLCNWFVSSCIIMFLVVTYPGLLSPICKQKPKEIWHLLSSFCHWLHLAWSTCLIYI